MRQYYSGRACMSCPAQAPRLKVTGLHGILHTKSHNTIAILAAYMPWMNDTHALVHSTSLILTLICLETLLVKRPLLHAGHQQHDHGCTNAVMQKGRALHALLAIPPKSRLGRRQAASRNVIGLSIEPLVDIS